MSLIEILPFIESLLTFDIGTTTCGVRVGGGATSYRSAFPCTTPEKTKSMFAVHYTIIVLHKPVCTT